MGIPRRVWFAVAAVSVAVGFGVRPAGADEWPFYGRDAGGSRYAPLRQITRENVAQLKLAWTFHTGEAGVKTGSPVAFEATPLFVDGSLFLSTPFNRIIALDPQSGVQRWVYDPKLDVAVNYSDFTSRGVSTWVDEDRAPGTPCRRRLFLGTNDGRLLAVDAADGKPCVDFGVSGQVDLRSGVGDARPWEYGVSSPPAIVNDLVIVGSKVADNVRIDAPSGVVRAYDARSGALRWRWEAIPPDDTPSGIDGPYRAGTANAWSIFSVDAERDLVFVPTGNTSPDYYGGLRNGSDFYGSSVVALRGATGELVWHFQTVHHDLWDYDVSAQPTLVDLKRDGVTIPVVVQATKMGHIFVLHRETGVPIFPVEERTVPQSTIPGERSAATQPFPLAPPRLGPPRFTSEDAWGLTPIDRAICLRRLAALRNEGLFTPPSFEGSLVAPGPAGGVNWGSVAFDPERQILIANYSNVPFGVRLIPRDRFHGRSSAEHRDEETAAQVGTPYGMGRWPLLSPLGLPCVKPPWGKLAAIDLSTGGVRWDIPFGTTEDLAYGVALSWGVPSMGGPIITAGGLVFIAAAMDNYLRAFDLGTGEELWKARLPAGGQATPMTYESGGKQYVVIAAGGHGRIGTKLGDSVLAFALP